MEGELTSMVDVRVAPLKPGGRVAEQRVQVAF